MDIYHHMLRNEALDFFLMLLNMIVFRGNEQCCMLRHLKQNENNL